MIDSIIFDLYLRQTELYFLERLMDGYGSPEEWPSGLFDHLLHVNDEFYSFREEAVKTVGSQDEVDKQLNLLHKRTGQT
jgi:hypothetical protein